MLNRSKVIKEISSLSDKLFKDGLIDFQAIQELWYRLIKDQIFLERIKNGGIESAYVLPTWSEKFSQAYAIKPLPQYTVAAVDGSQIYPDRHQGVACYLINVGTIQLRYEMAGKGIEFSSEPFVCLNDESSSPEAVNCLREEYELQAALKIGKQIKTEGTAAVLLDGSLIFWHLDSKELAIKERFLSRYFEILEESFKEQIPIASYISWPKSKELVHILKLYNDQQKLIPDTLFEKLLDSHISNFFLASAERSIIFQHHSPITTAYPTYLKPHFLYMNVGQEIARVEFPAWVAENASLVDRVTSIILDQAAKGRGYPVCLAEAHEQAVVKGADRDFFYHVLQKIGIEHKHRYTISQKSLRKRGIGI